jgi:hypothetical protein
MMRLMLPRVSPARLQAALRRTTEALARELTAPGAVAPEWARWHWTIARAAVSIHGIGPLLASRLRWRGSYGWDLFLREQLSAVGQRHLRLFELLELLDEALRVTGVAAVPLKGAALCAAGLYGPGERPMADLDILVRTDDIGAASAVLGALGFNESQRLWKNRLFLPGASGAAARLQAPEAEPIKVELHDRICEMLPSRVVDASRCVFPDAALPGLNPYPSMAALMTHLLLHAAGSMVDRALRLVQVHDIALLSARMSDEDWSRVLRGGAMEQPPWWAFPPLALTERYYPAAIPAHVLRGARAVCPWILRRVSRRNRLSSVSLSSPFIAAFPGIAWTRSPVETLEYLAERVSSTQEGTSMRLLAARTEPGLSRSDESWLRAPQAIRILKWAVLRPARPLTMRAVRHALGHSQE